MKTRNILYSIILLLSVLLINQSCVNPLNRCIRGNNVLAEEIRDLDNISGISAAGSFDVYVIKDSILSIKIEGDENILPYISTKNKNNTLYIEVNDNRCIKPELPLKVYIHTPNINYLSLSGSGEINCDSIDNSFLELNISGSGDIIVENAITESVEAEISGSGDIRIKGITTDADFDITGSGDIRALDLLQEKCFIDIAGSGSVYANVSDLLDVRITGSGSVYYTGNPDVNVSITGSGSVVNYN